MLSNRVTRYDEHDERYLLAMEVPHPLDPLQAKRVIEVILETGSVVLTFHCRTKSMPQRQVDMNDIRYVLKHGQIIREPEWDEGHQNWKYRVEGTDIEGVELTAIVAIEPPSMLVIVTVF